MIVLYNANCEDFNNNGIGTLKDATKCEVSETLNGELTLEIEYPINAKYINYIVNENIIKCDAGLEEDQLFRINYVKPNIYSITIYGEHITYDLADNFLEDVFPQNLNGSECLEWILSHTLDKHKFNSFSDIQKVSSARYVRKNPMQAIAGDLDNSFVNLWGGELKRNNFNISMLSKRGNDEGFKIKYRKNLIGLDFTIDNSNIVTKIMPEGYNGLFLPEKYVDSPLINNYTHSKVQVIEFSNVKVKENEEDEEGFETKEEAYEELRRLCDLKYSEENIDKPTVNLKVDFVDLSKTTEYKKYNFLKSVSIGDTVTIELDYTQVKVRVIKTKYDSLLHRYTKLELGEFKANYISNSEKNISNAVKKETENLSTTILDQAQISSSEALINAMGGNIYKTRQELFIMDTDNINTCKKVWRFNINGWGYSSNGVNGPYEMAATMDGSLVASMIKTGVLSADRIRGGTLALGGNNNYSGVFSLQNELAEELIRMDNRGIILSNGAKLIGGNGVLSNFQFGRFEWSNIGYSTNFLEVSRGEYLYVNIPVFIPKNFTIMSAFITIYHSAIKWHWRDKEIWGYCRNIKAYKKEDATNYYEDTHLSGEGYPENNLFDIEILNAFGEQGFNPKVAGNSRHVVEEATSIDIKNYLSVNKNTTIQIRTANEIPNLNPDLDGIYQTNYLEQTGNIKAIINVIGYMQ